MIAMFAALVVSVGLSFWIVRSSSVSSWMADHDLAGPQKIHAIPVPRVGGIGIVTGMVCGVLLLALRAPREPWEVGSMLLLCAIPAFATGLLEDLTKRISAGWRLLATALSAALAFWVLGAQVSETAIPGLDWVVSFAVGSLIVTVFAVAGIANSINIIDGLNGLASMCAIFMLVSLAYVAMQVGDDVVASLSLIGIGAILGFFVWNFPSGLIFLGDGGAYFLGFLVAELSIILLVRNPGVSPIFPLLVCVYPVFETVFSIYRRRVLRAMPSSVPDGIHLHSLIYRRVMRWAIGSRGARPLARRNSMASPYLWALCMLSVVPAVLFWDSGLLLSMFLLVFATAYVSLYWRIVRFKSPRWLRRRPSPQRLVAEADNPPL